MKNGQITNILRRDAEFVGQAVFSVVFAGFATLAVAAAVIDLMPG